MNKAELVQAVVGKAEVTHRDAEAVIEAVIATIEEEVLAGRSVKLSGFGNFEAKKKVERIGTNPSTGEKITIPATNTISFKVSKGLKAKMN